MTENVIERAFELARSGQYHTIEGIRRALTQERYSHVLEHLDGASIKRELMLAIRSTRSGEQ